MSERVPRPGVSQKLLSHQLDLPDEDHRVIVLLRDVEDMSYEEISAAIGVPVGTVKSRLFRGRRLLQESLYQYALDMGYVVPKDRR